MSYGMAAALQEAIYLQLTSDAAVTASLGSNVYDALPSGTPPALYAVLGGEEAQDRSDVSGSGARHLIEVTVVTSTAGFAQAKSAAMAISDALQDASLSLSRGRLVGLWFERALAQRLENGDRSITLRFAARVEDG